jgi:cytochrome c
MDIRSLAILIGVLLTSTSSAQEVGDAAAGEAVFRKCMSCHAVGEGARNKIGPVLNGIVGQPAGTLPDFQYSPAMVEAGENGLLWTPENLASYLSAPKEFLPGNKMAFPGLREQADIDNVIAYLASVTTPRQ